MRNRHLRRLFQRNQARLPALLLIAGVCLIGLLFAPSRSRAAITAPVLLTQGSSTRGVALDSITEAAEPFPQNEQAVFGGDRTRVMLFASNLTLAPGETATAVTVNAEDAALFQYPLLVEYVGPVPGQSWMTAVVVRLNDNFGDVGDVLVGISYHGMQSNRVRVGIGHIGGGPPDDPAPTPTPTPSPTPSPSPSPTPVATPDLGNGASLHGKQLF